VWTKFLNPDGYGALVASGRAYKVHRYAYELLMGSIPAGLLVCHRCDNPRCVNPDHLFLGTDSDNAADKVAKGRAPRGEQIPHAKLTEAAVIQIRSSGQPASVLAERFGVTENHVRIVRHGRSWKHVKGIQQ